MAKPTPPYKGPSGNWYTVSLFYEPTITFKKDQYEGIDPIFSLYHDRPGLISARKTFVELGDPTGYKWAMRYLGDYAHWVRLCKAPWFNEALEVWMHELNMKMKADAIEKIKSIATEGAEASMLAANKYLAEAAYDKPKAGRPTKESVKGELKKAIKIADDEKDDMERIGLRLVK